MEKNYSIMDKTMVLYWELRNFDLRRKQNVRLPKIKAPVTLYRIEPPNVKRIRIFVIRWCSSLFVLCPLYVRNIPYMCADVQFVRQHSLESFVHAQKFKPIVTNMNIRWLSCACPFCPVYLLLLFAIHLLDVRGSYVVQSVYCNLNVYATHKPDI